MNRAIMLAFAALMASMTTAPAKETCGKRHGFDHCQIENYSGLNREILHKIAIPMRGQNKETTCLTFRGRMDFGTIKNATEDGKGNALCEFLDRDLIPRGENGYTAHFNRSFYDGRVPLGRCLTTIVDVINRLGLTVDRQRSEVISVANGIELSCPYREEFIYSLFVTTPAGADYLPRDFMDVLKAFFPWSEADWRPVPAAVRRCLKTNPADDIKTPAATINCSPSPPQSVTVYYRTDPKSGAKRR